MGNVDATSSRPISSAAVGTLPLPSTSTSTPTWCIGSAASLHPRRQQGSQQDHTSIRWLASDAKEGGEVSNAPVDSGDVPAPPSGSSQHSTWVQFQQSIAVSGFETGQTTREKTLGKKSRGGKLARKRKEREAELEAMIRGDDTQLKGGEFPTLRYSDEETERLLAEAYAAIPPRAGKRGTNNLRRQKRRWWIKRMYDRKKKHERIAAHYRKMADRKRINADVRLVRGTAANRRKEDKAYHEVVLRRWAALNGHSKEVAVKENELQA